MPQKIPFFELFPALPLERDIRVLLDGAYLTAVEVEREKRAMRMALTSHASLGERKDALAAAIAVAYALENVSIHQTVDAPTSAAAPSKGEGVIMGTPIKGTVQPMAGLNPKMGNVVVAGKVFFADLYETRRPGVFCLTFDMTDFKTSVRVTKYMQKDEKAALKKEVKPGMWVKVQGFVKLNRDGSDILLDPKNIAAYPHEMRQDTAPLKRVELHAHTTFSNMDALSSLSPKAGPEGNIVKRAIQPSLSPITVWSRGSPTHGTPPRISKSSMAWRAISSTTWMTGSRSMAHRRRRLTASTWPLTLRPLA